MSASARPQRGIARALAAPAIATIVVAGAALVAQSPLHSLSGAAPVAAHLRLPAAYLVMEPISAILDVLSLLSLRQHLATMATLAGIWLLYRGVRLREWKRSRARRGLAATTLCVPGLAAGYLCLTLLPRPMAAIALENPGEVAVDFHSHTSASHDGNPWFGARENRAWHRAAGFGAAYVSDHGTYAAAAAASPLNPLRAGDGTMLLPALELRCQGEHLVLLGSLRPALSSCDSATLNEPGVVAILTIPRRLRPASVLPRVEAIEIADAAPRAFDQMGRDERVLATIAREGALARVASSNDHGWTRTAAAWSVVPVPRWWLLDARSLDAAIRAQVALGAASGIRVVERRRVVPPTSLVSLALTVPAVVWQMLRTLSPAERVSWVAWVWVLWLVALRLRRRSARRLAMRQLMTRYAPNGPGAARAARLAALTFAAAGALFPRPAHSQALETETARLIPRGGVEVGAALEVQHGGGAAETAVPLIVGVGLADRWELTLEPVPYTAIGAGDGNPRVTGVGDLEGTLTVRFADETSRRPAFALAAELKVPTARNALIGTGKLDYTAWAIASKRYGSVDTHYNVAYTVSGSPRGLKLNNTWTAAVAVTAVPSPAVELFAELMGVTSASPEGEGGDVTASPTSATTIPPEVAGAQLVGTLGAGRWILPGFLLFGSVSYDNTRATLGRIGTTIRFR